MERYLQVVLLMGGLGQRFVDAGFHTLKPLIDVLDRPMFLWALESLRPVLCAKKYVLAVPEGYRPDFEQVLHRSEYGSSAAIVSIGRKTRGPAETLSLVLPTLSAEPVLVLDCDVYIESGQYWAFIADVVAGRRPRESALVSFSSSDPRFSYARVVNDKVVETAEKRVISSHALAGAYFFSSAELLREATAELLSEERDGEFYISELYGEILAKNEGVKLFALDAFYSFGTPEERKDSVQKLRIPQA